jgi:hypothetical protein
MYRDRLFLLRQDRCDLLDDQPPAEQDVLRDGQLVPVDGTSRLTERTVVGYELL